MQKRQFIKDLVLTGIAMPLGLGEWQKPLQIMKQKLH